MQIVIDVPEIMYDWFDNGFPDEEDAKLLWELVKNGTPLPKGHGRLIDADIFQQYCFNKNFDKRLSEFGLAIINTFLEFQPTIIEEDKEESEKLT